MKRNKGINMKKISYVLLLLNVCFFVGGMEQSPKSSKVTESSTESTFDTTLHSLHDAAKKGDHILLKQLLDTGKYDLYERTFVHKHSPDCSAFEISVFKNHPKCVKLFLELDNFEIEGGKYDENSSTLAQACIDGYSEIVEMLINAGADIHVGEENDLTPLHNASEGPLGLSNNCDEEKYIKIIELLIAKGVDVNNKKNGEPYSYSPLKTAINGRHEKRAEVLCKHGALVTLEIVKEMARSGLNAMMKYYMEELNVPLKKQAQLEKIYAWGMSNRVYRAAFEGKFNRAKQLAQTLAKFEGHEDSFKILAQSIYDQNSALSDELEATDGLHFLLHEVINEYSLAKVKEVLGTVEGLEALNSLDQDGQTPLALAAMKGRRDFVLELIKHPTIDINKITGSGLDRWTPLEYACDFGQFEIVKILIVAGVRMDRVNHALVVTCDASLICLKEEEYARIISLLIEKGADPAVVNLSRIKSFKLDGLGRVVKVLTDALASKTSSLTKT